MTQKYRRFIGRRAGQVEEHGRNPSWWNLLITWPFAILFAIGIYQWITESRIAVRERKATGIITGHEPSNHGLYRYRFVVDGREYSGGDTPSNQKLRIGDPVVIYYDSLHPAENALTDFDEQRTWPIVLIPLELAVVGTVAGFIFLKRRRFRRRIRANAMTHSTRS